MHQIRFPLGLGHRTRWGAYSASQTSQLDLRGLLPREGKERGGKGRESRRGKCCPSNWRLWIRQWGRKGERQGGKLGLRRT